MFIAIMSGSRHYMRLFAVSRIGHRWRRALITRTDLSRNSRDCAGNSDENQTFLQLARPVKNNTFNLEPGRLTWITMVRCDLRAVADEV
jgi:hypothetical protein